MRLVLNAVLFLSILLFVSGLQAQIAPQQTEYNYQKDYPLSWTDIKQSTDTVIAANSPKRSVRVTIRTRKEPTKKHQVKGSFCMYNYCIDIAVNGKLITVPHSVFCDLNDLNRAKIFLEDNKSILMLDGGSSSMGYYVKIEFDGERVTRKAEYAGLSMTPDQLLEEITYHVATIE